jgi:hypothetical protein
VDALLLVISLFEEREGKNLLKINEFDRRGY